MDASLPARDPTRSSGSTARLRVRMLTDCAGIRAIRADWERCLRLAQQVDVELDREWIQLQYPRPDAEGFPAVAVVDEAGTAVGLLPCRILPTRWSCRIGYRRVASFPLAMADACGESVPAIPRQDVYEELLLAFAGDRPQVDLLFFESLRVESLLWDVLHTSPRVRRVFRVYRPQQITRHHLTRLPESFEEYLAGFRSEHRKRMKKRRRELESACEGRLRIERVTEREQVPAFLSAVEAVSAVGWKGRRLGRVLRATPDRIAEFGEYADRHWLRSYLMLCGDTPICFEILLQYGGILTTYETAYDPVWQRFQPGKVLILEILRDCFVYRKPAVFDWGDGEGELKSSFGNESFLNANVYLVRRTPRATAAWAAHAACAAIDRAGRRLLEAAHLTDRLRRRVRGMGDPQKG